MNLCESRVLDEKYILFLCFITGFRLSSLKVNLFPPSLLIPICPPTIPQPFVKSMLLGQALLNTLLPGDLSLALNNHHLYLELR